MAKFVDIVDQAGLKSFADFSYFMSFTREMVAQGVTDPEDLLDLWNEARANLKNIGMKLRQNSQQIG